MQVSHRSGFGPTGVIFCAFFTFAAVGFAGTYSGGSGTAEDPYQIATAEDLIVLGQTPDDYGKCFILTAEIDMAGKGSNLDGSFPRAVVAPDTDDATWGYQGTPFSGRLNGNGLRIQNLTIDAQGVDRNYLGLFGQLDTEATVEDLGLEDNGITGGTKSEYLGGICGKNGGSITNCFATGAVTGWKYLGGLCGLNEGTINHCNATGPITGRYTLGGLCGQNGSMDATSATINKSYATGSVSGNNIPSGGESGPGGLCGSNSYGTIYDSFATGSVSGAAGGGLCGRIEFCSILGCYATGIVNGSSMLGGLIGIAERSKITNCYATGSVTGTGFLGGLCAWVYTCTIQNCYATGSVTGSVSSTNIGGFNGWGNTSSILSCFWDSETSGQVTSFYGVGLPTSAMQNPDTYLRVFWDFKGEIANGTQDIWAMPVGGGYPVLAWQVEESGVANDEMAQAIEISVGSVVEGTTIGASGLDLTRNGYNDCIDVWYSLVSAEKDEYTVTVEGTDFDTTLGVFDEAQREVAFNDDYFGNKSVVILKATPGKQYYLRVAGQDGQTGVFRLSVSRGAIQAIQGDLNYDGKVDLVDLSLMAQNWLMGV
jgi:hypothetical protein